MFSNVARYKKTFLLLILCLRYINERFAHNGCKYKQLSRLILNILLLFKVYNKNTFDIFLFDEG